jgi:hypothetical protein
MYVCIYCIQASNIEGQLCRTTDAFKLAPGLNDLGTCVCGKCRKGWVSPNLLPCATALLLLASTPAAQHAGIPPSYVPCRTKTYGQDS